MDRSYVEENDSERARLEALVAKWSDEQMAKQFNSGWTATVALMHLAFWDRQWLLKYEEWETTGLVRVPEVVIADMVGVAAVREFTSGANDGMLPWWRTFTPAEARREVMAAAQAVDSKAVFLPEGLVQEILAVRPRTLIRAVHRREHLDEIERALTIQLQQGNN